MPVSSLSASHSLSLHRLTKWSSEEGRLWSRSVPYFWMVAHFMNGDFLWAKNITGGNSQTILHIKALLLNSGLLHFASYTHTHHSGVWSTVSTSELVLHFLMFPCDLNSLHSLHRKYRHKWEVSCTARQRFFYVFYVFILHFNTVVTVDETCKCFI